MAEQLTVDFSRSAVEKLFQEAHYDGAIALLSQRVDAHPADRMARLMLLLANVLKFGATGYEPQVEELQSIIDLSSDERSIVLRIYFAGYHYSKREGQTNRKIAYLSKIRQFTLQQPIDVSVIETRDFVRSNNQTSAWKAWFPTDLSMAGATAVVVTVFLGLYVATGRRMLDKQNTDLSVHASASSPLETPGQTSGPAVILPATYVIGPAREILATQLDSLNKSYARWSQSGPAMSGTVALKLTVEPSGNIIKVDEVVSRLSEHLYLDAVIAEAKKWKLPHSSKGTTEITVPLLFIPGQAAPATLTAQGETRQPALLKKSRLSPHTTYALEQTELPTWSENAPMSKIALAAHTRGRLEVADDSDFADTSVYRDAAAAKRELASIPSQELEIETSRTVALKHEPRYAAAAVEKVGLGTRVMVLRKERDWIKVKVNASGNVGYMRKEFLTAFNTLR